MGGHVFDTCVVLDLLAAGVLHVAAHNLSRPGIGHLAAHEDNELARYRDQLVRYGVRVCALSGAGTQRISQIRSARPALSTFDVEAALIAESRHAVLLTNERLLRKLAADLGTTAHGSLWVIRTLVDRGFIDPPAGLTALSAMREADSRLPEAECTRLRREMELMSSRGSG